MAVKSLKRWFGISENETSSQVNPKLIKTYGDHLGDGALQLSFTLPIPLNDEAIQAAIIYAEKLGLKRVNVAASEDMGNGFSFFLVYGFSDLTIDLTKIKVSKVALEKMSFEKINETVLSVLQRKAVIVGATTGSDAHTVGIDAILNMKGYAGDYGLEKYPCFNVHNLRAQVSNEELIQRAIQLKADAILVSKLVTQQDQHLEDLKDLMQKIKQSKELPAHLIKIAGGPRITHPIATKLGFDAGFGGGTLPSEVASFIAMKLIK